MDQFEQLETNTVILVAKKVTASCSLPHPLRQYWCEKLIILFF